VNTFGLSMCALEAIDCIIFVVFRPKFRVAFIARTGYLVLLPSVRRLALCIMAVIWEFLSIAAFYVGTLIFFAWMAVIIFKNTDGEIYGKPINKGFKTFSSTMYTMFVAGSTDEFVGCLLPTYSAFRPAGLLWLSFLVIVQVLLLNLVLDTLVAAYTRYNEETEEEEIKEKVEGICEAFEMLSEATGESDMQKGTFLEFIQTFSRSPNIRSISDSQAEIVFRSVDKDGGGTIDKREFFDICAVIQYDFWTTSLDSTVKTSFPGVWNNPTFVWFRSWVHEGGFDSFMNMILLVNLCLVVTESVYDLNGWSEAIWMENLELCFSLVYVGEVGLKLCVISFSEYWALRSNQFDFFTTWMLLASSVLDELAQSVSGGNIKRYMNILRLLRLLRVIKQLKRFQRVQLMVETIIQLVSASKHIMTLLGTVTFLFSALSVQLWGGLLYVGNEKLEETEYEEKQLYVLNFNDFPSSFGVWVVMLLCEYVPDFPEAISKVSSIKGSWLVFLLFYMGGVSIVFELVKAFTIEVFLELHKHWGKEKKEFQTLLAIQDEFEQQGLTLHYRIVGDTSMHEKMVHELDEQEEEAHGHGHGHGHGEGGHH
jgi:two pore calcium channel protein